MKTIAHGSADASLVIGYHPRSNELVRLAISSPDDYTHIYLTHTELLKLAAELVNFVMGEDE